MSQISPPLRILLIGAVVFLVAWLAFLRPGGGGSGAKTAATPATTAVPAAKDPSQTASTSLGRDVQKAEVAKAQTEAAQSKSMGETSTPSSSTTGGAAAPAKAATAAKRADIKNAMLPLSVAKAMASKKVMVLLFWDPKAADDRAVRRAVRGLDTHHHQVVVQVANVKDVARYQSITRGVDVEQSPSVVVVDRKLQGDLLSGYVDRQTIEQAVSDALRAG